MDRTSKDNFLAEYGERLKNAKVAILADYRGITVAEINAFRAKVRKVAGVEFRVGKNTLLRSAFKAKGWNGLDDLLKGPTGVLLGDDDIVEAAKIATDFAKQLDKFQIKGGIAEGQVMDKDGVTALSTMATKPELRGQLLGLMTAAPSKLLSLFNTPGSKFLGVLEARKDQLEGKDAPS